MGDDVGPRSGDIDADAHPGEADLVAFERVATAERGLDRRDIAQVDSAGGIIDGRVGGEPERLVRKLLGKTIGWVSSNTPGVGSNVHMYDGAPEHLAPVS